MAEEFIPAEVIDAKTEILVPTTPARDALNRINAVYYGATPEAFSPESKLAVLFNSPDIQKAIAHHIVESFPYRQHIRIKEIMAGSRLDRIAAFTEGFDRNRQIDLVLSDFSNNSLPDRDDLSGIENNNIHISTEAWNAFTPMETLPDERRYDAMFTTYGFDSVWLPSDSRVIKRDGQWYEVRYQIQVPEGKQNLAKALSEGYSDVPIPISEFEGLEVIEHEVPTDIKKIPYGEELAARYDPRGEKRSVPPINVPGGLIDTVQEAFDKQIKPDGIMIIGDVAVNDRRGYEGFEPERGDFSSPRVMGIETTGKVAKYKIEDYGLAQAALEARGFDVMVGTLHEFAEHNGVQLDNKVGKDQKVMIVRKLS